MPGPHIVRRSLLAGAADAADATIIIDTFRAFSTAADLLARRVDRIILTETLDEARATARSLPDSLHCGEEEGRRPDDFDLGNSPAEVRVYPDPAGRVVVTRTSSGTRAVGAALRSGADPVFAASLMVAGATADAVRLEPPVTIVAAGLGGTSIADEDEETAGLVSDRLLHRPDDGQRLDRLKAGEGAQRLRTKAWIDPADLDCCLKIDRHSFALRAVLDQAFRPFGPAIQGIPRLNGDLGSEQFKILAPSSDTTECVGRRGVMRVTVGHPSRATTR